MNASFISEVEEILQHLKADDVPEPIDDVPEPIGDIQKLESILNDRLVYADKIMITNIMCHILAMLDYTFYLYSKPQAVLNGAVIEGDISPKPSHKQDSQG